MKPVLSVEETLRLEDLIEKEGTSNTLVNFSPVLR